jgi:hypothetical protein
MSEMAFKDRWEGGDLLAELRDRFSDFELNWAELAGLIDDRPVLITRLVEATGLDRTDVKARIEQADRSTL